jgi:MFS family permease
VPETLTAAADYPWGWPRIAVPLALAAALVGLGLAGFLTAAWGYALFLASGALLGAGVLVFSTLVLTRRGETEKLTMLFRRLFFAGAWSYVWAVAAFAGHFTLEALAGRIELKWMLFGPVILAALVVLDYGLYRRLVQNNLPTWRRYRQVISREAVDPKALRKTLVDEVILHRSLYAVDRFRWLRHTFIFWGFAAMFLLELAAVFVREAMPAFGLPHVWADQSHPVRLAFDFLFDLFGVMVLVGCAMALAWRIKVNGTELQKYTDTPTAVFLLFVVVSGFVVEGMRIAGSPPSPTYSASFAGYATAALMPGGSWVGGAAYEAMWLIHVLGSCLFIAYVPVMRLIHSCATPLGRLMNSQKQMLAAKKQAVLSGLMLPKNRLE